MVAPLANIKHIAAVLFMVNGAPIDAKIILKERTFQKMNNNFSSYIIGLADGSAQRAAEKEAREPKETEITFYIKENTRTRERQLRREHKLRVFSGWAFLAGLCWGLTPYFFYIARLARNSNALGGEIIIPIIPFICFLLHTAENKRTKK